MLVSPPTLSPPSGVDYGWVRATDDGAVADHGNAPLALLPTASEVTLLVPNAALSWHRLTLPQGSLAAGRLRPVLEGLLEEHLLDDPDTVHYALQPGAKVGEPIWVAVCERAALRATVQALEDAGKRVARIVPEFAPQPDEAPALVLATGEPEAPRLTVCDANGVVTLPMEPAAVSLALSAPLDTVVLSAEPAVAAQAESLLGQRVPIVQRAQRWLQADNGPWDLAQFEFASSGRARAGKRFAAVLQSLRRAPQWRAARWGAVVVVAAQLVGLNAWAWKERGALDAKRSTINSILTQTFPSVKLVVDAPVQMSREVAALQQATGGVATADFEPVLGALAVGLPPGRVPTAVDFSAGQLRLRGLGLSQAEVSKLGEGLAPRGYSARAEGDLLLIQAEASR
jgi:general secretion pathway protein L